MSAGGVSAGSSRGGGLGQLVGRMPGWARVSAALALVGVGVSIYLTYAHFNKGALVCGLGDCSTVQGSQFATIAGVPIAVLGLGQFVALLLLGVGRVRAPQRAELFTYLAFGLSLAGTLYSIYLTYLEIAVIRAICQWCVVSAICVVGICLAEGVGVMRLARDDE